jgi:hypothetical protein
MLSRRDLLGNCVAGSLGLYPALSLAAQLGDGRPVAPKPPPFEPRAKHLVFIFLTGGFSHVDTFDYKPKLRSDDGRFVPGPTLRESSNKPLLASPFEFRPRGKSGLMISDLFPCLGEVADELCVIRTLHTDIVEHFQGVLAMHTGSATVPMPSIGAWLSFGLGTLNNNLPSYMVLCEFLPYAGAQVWDNNFLPPYHQGVRIVPGNNPIPDLQPQARSVKIAELEAIMLKDLNERHSVSRIRNEDLRARTNSFGVAHGMMREAPEAFGTADETSETLAAYNMQPGDNTSLNYQCLLARRLVERGVRVVEVIDTGASNNWDSHGNMQDHLPKAKRADQPIAALIKDLKARGLLDETLVAICTEFGRTPFTDAPGTKGRNHYAQAFSCLLAGGGVRGGTAYGETDEYGLNIVSNPCHVHDYHATILHLMGIDHTQLTYRYAGRDFRLTDVSGKVMHSIFV